MIKKVLSHTKEDGFIATAVLYSLLALLTIVFYIILSNYRTIREVQKDGALSAKEELSKYSIEYHPTTGEGNMEPTIGYTGQELYLSENTFTKEGADFMGWSLNPEADLSMIDFQDKESVLNIANPQGTCHLYAVWKWKEYNIQFVSSAGTTNLPDPIVKTHGFDINLPNTTPIKKGYIFKGWTLTKNGTRVDYSKNSVFSLNGDTVLYAVWKKNTLTVNGGSLSLYKTGCNISHTHGSNPAPSSGDCFASGNRFGTSWSHTSSGGGSITASSYNTFDVTDFDYVTINYKSENGNKGNVSIGGASQAIGSSSTGSVTINISKVTGTRRLDFYLFSSFNDHTTIESRTYSVRIESLVFFS